MNLLASIHNAAYVDTLLVIASHKVAELPSGSDIIGDRFPVESEIENYRTSLIDNQLKVISLLT